MILQCPECSSRFMVADALIPSEGRMVRCGKCKHDWHVAHPQQEVQPMDAATSDNQESLSEVFAGFNVSFDEALKAEQEKAEIDDSASAMATGTQATQMKLPAIAPKHFQVRPFIFSTAAMLILVLIMAPIAYYPNMKTAPVFSGLYSLLGWKNTEGLILADMNMTKEKNEGVTRFIISGNLINQSDHTRVVPIVRIAMKDIEAEDIWSREYQVNKTLRSGDIYPFRITNAQTSFGDKVSQITVDVGNGYELMVR